MAMVSKVDTLKKQKGFTLLETLLVLVIIGILSSLILPSVSNIISNHKLERVAKEIVSDMRYIQQLAISSEKNYRLILNNFESNPPNTYYIKNVSDNKTIKKVILPSDISIYLSKRINFKPNGTTENATITLQNKNQKTLFVVCYMWGRFRVTNIQP